MAAEAQAPANTVRIGWLGLAAPTPEVLRVVNAFKNGLRELGYVDGQNLAFEYRWAHGQSDRLRPLVAELIRLKVDVIAAGNPNRSPWQRTRRAPFPSWPSGPSPSRSASARISRARAAT
jgi:hypothetical protein